MLSGDVEQLLKQAMGLDAASIGHTAIERAVQERVSACSLPDQDAYWQYLCASAPELQLLIETVVVPETWFFRDPAAFAALAQMARENWLPGRPQGVLRLLSLPCSTGEEPYSMAMALLDAGLAPDRFLIDAVDISARSLALAARAVYGRNSFRGGELGFRERHFEALAQGHRPSPAVRASVRFQQGNLLAADFLQGSEIYDAVFCRNVLIYFDRATQDRAVAVLRRLLAAGGTLFVGPAETGLLFSQGFVSARIPLAFAFRKTAPVRAQAERLPGSWVPPPPAPPRRPPAATPLRQRPFKPDAVPPPSRSEQAPDIDAAARLADQGRLVEAAKACEEHQRTHGHSARAFHLMGLIRNAAGNLPEAVQQFRKALYLDPDYYEALVHLAFLLEKQGDAAGAQTLRKRARRLELKVAQ